MPQNYQHLSRTRIREHSRMSESAKAYQAAAFSRGNVASSECSDDYACAFKELFCVAASQLATTIQVPLEKLGVLFDQIMNTGTLKRTNTIRSMIPASRAGQQENAQAEQGHAPMLLGRGQLLFAVRQASKSDSTHLQAAGYCFTNPTNVIDSLARSMQVPQEEIASRINRIQDYVSHERILEPGVHLACFALRPLLQRGFDVLVMKDAHNLLPTVSLPITQLEPWQVNFLARMDTWTVISCCERLHSRSLSANQEEQHFGLQLFQGIKALADRVGNGFFEDARLIARPFRAPCRLDVTKPRHAFIIAFRTITDIHEISTVNRQCEFAPLRFFICQQHTYRDSPDIDLFARRIHQDFAAIVESVRNRHEQESNPFRQRASSMNGWRGLRSKRSSSAGPRGRKWPRTRTFSCGDISIDNISEKHLVHASRSLPSSGISVSNDVNVDVRRESASPENLEMRNLGVCCEAGMGYADEVSFAEKLVAITIDERTRKR
ncbi:MAG: hypothetical protein Q9217_006739 [Psora testacea]